MRRRIAVTSAVLFSFGLTAGWVWAAETPSVELAMRFRPVQKDVEYGIPPANQYGQCRVEVERATGSSGWIVLGPAGLVLRRYVDTNGDNVVDQWRYYNHGLEVYRDLDTNFNNKVDESRWLNTGGTRWGVDSDEDGRIDFWKRMSAEEASRVAVLAIVESDLQALKTLLVTQDDVEQLGVSASVAEKLLEAVSDSDRKLRAAIGKSRLIQAQTKWMRFDSVMPSLIPSEGGKTESDLLVHENAMAIVDTAGNTGLIQFGEMVRVGDVWKLTQIPQPLEGNSVQVTLGGVLMHSGTDAAGTGTMGSAGSGEVSAEMQRLLQQLQELDQAAPAPNAGRAALANHASQRSSLLSQLVSAAKTAEDKEQWMRQLVDHLASGAQTGSYPEGVQQLRSIESDLTRTSPSSPLVPYVIYRRLMAEYGIGMQSSDTAEQQKVQEKWLANLRNFVQTYATSEDAADAMLQLAVHFEFSGKLKDARDFYAQVAGKYPKTSAGMRASGAVRRLDLAGKPIQLSGPRLGGGTVDISQYRGRVVLVLCWATWCTPCTEDLPQIRSLYAQYRDRGFEIMGVNLDTTPEPVTPFLTQNRVTWPQIYQPGGLASPIAQSFGIVSLPTMFLVDARGAVITSSASVDDLKTRLPELLKK